MSDFFYRLFCDADANRCAATWTALTALAAIAAAVMAFIAFRSQIAQSKTELWRSLSQEFDHVLGGHRGMCGTAYRFHALNTGVAQKILDFFETLSYLIRNYRIEGELAKHTFAHYFAHYYKACEAAIAAERAANPNIYSDLDHLAKRWRDHVTRVTPESLNEFFDLESRFAKDEIDG